MLLDYPSRKHVSIYSIVNNTSHIYLYIIPSFDSSIHSTVHPSKYASCIYLSMYVSIYVSIYLCIYLSMYVSIYVSIYLYLFIHLHVPGGDFVCDSRNHIEFQCDYKYKTSSENNVIIYLFVYLFIHTSIYLKMVVVYITFLSPCEML